MNTIIHFLALAMLFISLFPIRPLFADLQVEPPSERIEILNNGRVIKTISAKPFIRKDLQWIAIRVKRRDFTIFPTHSHLHIEITDENGMLLKTDYRKLSDFDFHHTVTGRHRDKTIRHNTGIGPSFVSQISIQSYEKKHDHQ